MVYELNWKGKLNLVRKGQNREGGQLNNSNGNAGVCSRGVTPHEAWLLHGDDARDGWYYVIGADGIDVKISGLMNEKYSMQ